VVDKRNPLVALVPLWVVAAVVGVLVVGLHLFLGSSLNGRSEPVFSDIHAIKVAAAALPPAPVQVKTTGSGLPRLAVLLKSDIDEGKLAVTEQDGRATVTVHGDGLFASGSSELRGDYLPLVVRIGEALRAYPGSVLITGHTDDQRIVSARFPSNWKLSLERANAVLRTLAAQAGSPDRFRAAGRGETEPLVPNDTPEHRAQNRRVDITITTAGSGT
jgi:type VI secretion system protein ImpK